MKKKEAFVRQTKYFCCFLLLVIFITSCELFNKEKDSDIDNDPETIESNWVLTWSDEFNGSSIDTSKWIHDIGTGVNGWGNEELQYFTDSSSNSYIENGELVIEAKQESFGGMDYTSARLKTEGLQSFRYGKLEARIKLPYGEGIWPAFWLLGDNYSSIDWPYCGEIDIMELTGGPEDAILNRGDNKIHGNVHWYGEAQEEPASLEERGEHILASGIWADNYHIFSIEWDLSEIRWYVDGEQYHSVNISDEDELELNRSHYLILNVAVGGYWPGFNIDTTVLPQKMYVDYVRYYEESNLDPPAETSPSDDEFPSDNYYFAAMDTTIPEFATGTTIVYGGDNQPVFDLSDQVSTGSESASLIFPGAEGTNNWGGGYFETENSVDMSAYAAGSLIFDLKMPASISDFELKMESAGGSRTLYIIDYIGTSSEVAVNNGFSTFTIPITDFLTSGTNRAGTSELGVDLSTLTIPLAIWNPLGPSGETGPAGEIIIDNITFTP